MSLTTLTTDLNHIQTLADQPNANDGMTPEEVKEAFDQAGNDIKTYINSVLTVEIDTIVTNIINELALRQLLSEKGTANGYASLDSGGKIPTSQIPSSIIGKMEYKGAYNAATNTPTLPSASTSTGWYYIVSVAGTVSGVPYDIKDWIVSNGTTWDKIDNTDAVTSFKGRLGAIVPLANDYLFSQIDKTISSLADLTTRSASDLNSGTLDVLRSFAETGDVTRPAGSSVNTLAATGVTPGTYTQVIVDAKGRVVSGVNPTSLAAYGITDAAPLSHVGSGGIAQHADATTAISGFISVADLIYLRSLVPGGLASYSIPVGQALSFWSRYSLEQDATTGEMVIYEI